MTHRTRFAALALALAATTTACASSPSATSTPLGPVTTTATTGSAAATTGSTGGSSAGSTTGATSHSTHRSTQGTGGSTSPTGDRASSQGSGDAAPGQATPTEQNTDDGAPGYVDGEGLPGESTPTHQHTDDGAPGYEDSAADTVPTEEADAQVPVLGSSAADPAGRGLGQERPSTISLGGDPTGVVTDITWDSWGGRTAVGHGTGSYLAPGKATYEAVPTRATVRLSDVGVCGGRRAYRTVTWSFPSKAGAGNDSVTRRLAC